MYIKKHFAKDFREKNLMVESSQMLGLKMKKTTGLIWLQLSKLN